MTEINNDKVLARGTQVQILILQAKKHKNLAEYCGHENSCKSNQIVNTIHMIHN